MGISPDLIQQDDTQIPSSGTVTHSGIGSTITVAPPAAPAAAPPPAQPPSIWENALTVNPMGIEGPSPADVQTAKGVITGDPSVANPDIGSLRTRGLGLSPFDPKSWGIEAEAMLNRDPIAMRNVIKQRVPDAQFSYDKTDSEGKPTSDSNLMVQVPGNPPMYVDRPGLNPQKALYYTTQALPWLLNAPSTILRQAGLGGVQHALSQLGSWALGGAQSPVDLPGTALAAALPAGIGAAGSLGMTALDYALSAPGRAATDIAERAKSLFRWGFQPKAGDITGNARQLQEENAVAQGGSAASQQMMQDFHNTNFQQNQTNKLQLTGNISGDIQPGGSVANYSPSESGFGDTLNTAVRDKAAALDSAESAAWGKLRPLSPDTASGRSVVFSPDASTDVMSRTANLIRERYGSPQGPNGTYTPEQLGDGGQQLMSLWQRMQSTMRDSDGNLQSWNLGHYQDMRQGLQNIINDSYASGARTTGGAATAMKSILDDVAGKADANGWLSGDPQGLADFRAANAASRANYAFRNPNTNPSAARYIDRVLNAPGYSGQQSINDVFGGSGSVVGGGGGTNQIVSHLVSQLGNDAADPLRGALVMRPLYSGRGTPDVTPPTGKPSWDYTTTANAIRNQVTPGSTGSDVADMLLPPDARTSLLSYAHALDVLGSSTRPVGPTLNPSGTAALQNVIKRFAPDIPGVGPLATNVMATSAANRSLQQGIDITKRAVAGATTPRDLNVTLPRTQSPILQDPRFMFHDWKGPAWRAGAPAYGVGGLFGSAPLQQPTQPWQPG
jgi:hypothetical protein